VIRVSRIPDDDERVLGDLAVKARKNGLKVGDLHAQVEVYATGIINRD
jgi:hypothetical protein